MSDLFAALIALTMDLSGGDAALVEKVTNYTKTPPTTRQEIGYYGAEDESAPERVLRATISALLSEGYVLGFEDKYIYEMPEVLMNKGWIARNEVTAQFLDTLGGVYENRGAEAADAFAVQIFPDHVAQIEAAAQATGHDLLFFALPVGDTFHVARVMPDIAAKWRNVLLLDASNNRFAVTEPDWALYWDFLTYAAGITTEQLPVLDARPALRTLSEIGF